MNRSIGKISSIAALLLGSSAVFAQGGKALEGTIDFPDGNEGYVESKTAGTPTGTVLRSGLGDCVIDGLYNSKSQIDACEGIEPVVEPPPAPAPAPAPVPVVKEPVITIATLGGEALFANNSADLNESSEQALAELVSQLEKFQEISAINVVGHTDSTGTASYNQELSERRAAAVETFLAAAYPNVAITSSGVGEDSPVATNSTPEGRQLNRRVEIQVTAKSITE